MTLDGSETDNLGGSGQSETPGQDPSGISKSELDLLGDENDEKGNVSPIESDDHVSSGDEEDDEKAQEDDTNGDETVDETENEDESKGDSERSDEQSIFKSLKTKYPDIYKNFPELRKTIVQHQQFSQIFPTIEDADISSKKAEAFDVLDETLAKGDIEPLYKVLANRDPKIIDGLAKNLLPALEKVNPQAYAAAAMQPIKLLLQNALRAGESSKNQNLRAAAQHIAHYLLGDQWKEIFQAEKEQAPDPKVKELEEKLQQQEEQRANDFNRDVREEANRKMKEVADKIIGQIERKAEKKLTVGQREYVFATAMRNVAKKISQDQAHMRTMDNLFANAQKAAYASEWKPRVIDAHLGRAKNLLPTELQRLANEELGVNSNPPEEKEDEKDSKSSKFNRRVQERGGNLNRSRNTVEKDPDKVFKGPKRMTEEEFLAQ